MELPAGVQIVSITQSPYLKPNNMLGQQTAYRFNVGMYGPFTVLTTEDQDTPEKVQQLIGDRITHLRALGLVA